VVRSVKAGTFKDNPHRRDDPVDGLFPAFRTNRQWRIIEFLMTIKIERRNLNIDKYRLAF